MDNKNLICFKKSCLERFLPRQTSFNSTSRRLLPWVREIKEAIHVDEDSPDKSLSQVTMTFGQFLSHGIIKSELGMVDDSAGCCPCTTDFSYFLQRSEKQCFPFPDPGGKVATSQCGCTKFVRTPEFCPDPQRKSK